jgi:anaerobic selenocysteine-containing dehydrogenase
MLAGMANRSLPLHDPSADEIKTTTCYMCACRCGIRVHLRGGEIRYIDGNPGHPVNRGVICGKGAAGAMTHRSAARLRAPLRRVGPRGAGEFVEISWEEALATATEWLSAVRRTDPKRLAFFTGRDQSQSLTGFWAAQFGTPNFAAHGGFCSVNMAAAGLYTIGGSFWEFGEPDFEHARYFLMFGVAEDHDSNPLKLGLSRLKARGAKIVSVNPVRTGYSAIADEWIGIRPGTDGLFVGSLIRELLLADRVDGAFLAACTNAPWLVVEQAGGATDGLFARDEAGRVLARDRTRGIIPADTPDLSPVLVGEVTLPDGRRARPVFEKLALRFLSDDYAPEAIAARTGIGAECTRRIARELAAAAFDAPPVLPIAWTDVHGHRHESVTGRPVAMHAMRGISAHANGFHTCRAIHILQMLLGAVDRPGAWRPKAPFPRPIPPGPAPAGRSVAPETPITGTLLGFPHGPEDLLLDEQNRPLRIDHAFSWEAPLALHGMMHTVIANAADANPYPIEVLFLFMANMAWNSAMNPEATIEALTRRRPDGEYAIPRIIYSDAYASETVPYADLVLPDTTYLERWDCISLLDRPIGSAHGPADAIRQPVVTPDREVRPFQEVLIELGARLGLPGFVKEDGSPRYRDYADYIVNHERSPGIGPLAGWRGADGTRAGTGEPNPDQLQRYIENGGFWRHAWPPEQAWMRFRNRDYLAAAKAMGLIGSEAPIVLQIWSEPLARFRLAALGHGERQPPEHLRARLARHCDPLPFWGAPEEGGDFPLSAVTQRPMPMYHSWGTMNPWLRQILAENRLYMHRDTAARLGLAEGEWVEVEGPGGRVRARLALQEGVNPDTVWTWNAIGKRAGAWRLPQHAPEAERGFLLNHAIAEWLPSQEGSRRSNSDPVTGQAAWYDLRVRVSRAEAPGPWPRFDPLREPPGLPPPPSLLRVAAGRHA